MTTTRRRAIALKDLLSPYRDDRNTDRPLNSPLSERSIGHLAECIHVFTKYLRRPATTRDLTDKCVNDFLRSLLVNGKSDYTIKNRRTGILVIWRFAARRGYLKPPTNVQKVRVNPLSIKGYDSEAITRLVEYVTTLRGVIRSTGLRKPAWWETFILVDWEFGLRSGDMAMIEPQHFDRDGWIWVVEHKTGKRGWHHVRPALAKLVADFIDWEPDRQFIWPGYKRRNLYKAFNQIADAAGVGGSMRWIRRGAASEVECLNPGAGWRFLRHSVPTIFDKHYRVEKICEQHPLAPPEIDAKVFRP